MYKKLFTKFILFFSISIVLLLTIILLTSKYVINKNLTNSQTESNTLIIKKNQNFDLMFMGISHARNFSRKSNHDTVEKILNKKIINIAKGGGKCGVNEQLFYLQYYYSKGNKVNTIIYVLSPPMLFSEKLPISSSTFDDEIFDFDFLFQYLNFDSENKYQRLVQYTQTKLSKNWIYTTPDTSSYNENSLVQLDMIAVKKGMEGAYQKTNEIKRFYKSCEIVEQTILLAQKNKTKVVFIIPPALFGKWLMSERVEVFSQKMKLKYNVNCYDYSNSVMEPKWYYDHHHLNSKGVSFFTNFFFKTYVNKRKLICFSIPINI